MNIDLEEHLTLTYTMSIFSSLFLGHIVTSETTPTTSV